MTTKRVLLIGGTGVFGQRLARHLAGMDGLDLTITSRSQAKARALADSIATAATTTIRGIGLDHRRDLDAALAKLSPWLVIDASGPFQGASYDVPRAALTAGAHVVDLADARDYILGFGPALDSLAHERGLVALAGASSTPALSCAAVTALTEGWRRVDTLDITITPGGRSEVGEAVIAAILSYAGRPIPIWREGELQQAHGWIDGRRVAMPGLGSRRVTAVETVDAQWLGPRLDVRSRVAFQAGLESPVEQFGIGMLARLRKRGWLGNLKPLISALLAGRKLTRLPTSDRGGMLVEATGLDADGELRTARWSLLAERGDGPHVPTLPAAAALRALLAGQIAPGARPAAGALTLAAIKAEMTPYAISTHNETTSHGEAVFEAALGKAAFAALAAPLKTLHGKNGPPVWHGRSEIETGNGFIARLLRKIIGLPPAGRDIPLTFSIERIASPSGPIELWTRNFGGARFSSRLSTNAGGELWETFGPLSFRLGLEQFPIQLDRSIAPDPCLNAFSSREPVSTSLENALAAHDGGLALPVATMRCLGLPLPSFLQPKSQAREYADTEGRFHFDVKLTLPFIGLLAHYKGWLLPAGGASEPRREMARPASHPAG